MLGHMTFQRQSLGRRGEDLAVGEIKRRGWHVIERNARLAGNRGEIDIVADDGRDLVFVEVKSVTMGSLAGPHSPLEMVGRRKRAQLRALAGIWCEQHGDQIPGGRGIRIDVVAVRFRGDGRPVSLERVEAAC